MDFELSNLYTAILGGLTVAILTGLFATIFRAIKKVREIKEWKGSEIANKLVSELIEDRLELITSPIYIPTMGQKDGPHNNENVIEPDANRYPLVEKLLNEILSKNAVVGKKRYAILGGSGMGKSTFSAALFHKYTYRYKFKKSPWPIYVKYLGKKNVLKEIQNIDEPNISQSIIILDALDENIEATKNLKGIMDKIEELTDKFKFVILSSRTQLFPNELCEPHRGSVIQNGGTRKLLTWEKIYISPFSKEETEMFLENKYQIGSKQYQKAIHIMEKTKDLMTRPMVLSFIDDLLDFSERKDLTMVEIYGKIIDEWLKRECEGLSVSKSDLYTFSKKLSLFIYEKWIHSGEASLSEDEYLKFVTENGYKSSLYSLEERSFKSLINRKSDGSIKFSHKSFWEFFIALDVLENPGKSYNPDNLDMAKKFTDELNKLYIQGSELDDIEYFECDYTRYTKEEAKILRNYIDSLKQEISQTEDITLLCNLWDKIEGYIIGILLGDGNQQYFGQNSIQELKSFINNALYKLTARMFVNQIQECLYKNDINCKNHIGAIEKTLTKIEKHIEENTNTKILFPLYKKQKVIFPNLFVYNNQMVNDTLSNDLICIGSGFYDNHSMYNLIVKILTVNPDIYLINVIKNCTNLEDATKFVSELTEKIKNSGLKIRCNIVVSFKINDTDFVYLLNTNNIYSQINTCLSKMYNLKSSKITS